MESSVGGGNGKYSVRTHLGRNANTALKINRPTLDVAGVYTVKVTTPKHTKEESFHLTVKAKPKVQVLSLTKVLSLMIMQALNSKIPKAPAKTHRAISGLRASHVTWGLSWKLLQVRFEQMFYIENNVRFAKV